MGSVHGFTFVLPEWGIGTRLLHGPPTSSLGSVPNGANLRVICEWGQSTRIHIPLGLVPRVFRPWALEGAVVSDRIKRFFGIFFGRDLPCRGASALWHGRFAGLGGMGCQGMTGRDGAAPVVGIFHDPTPLLFAWRTGVTSLLRAAAEKPHSGCIHQIGEQVLEFLGIEPVHQSGRHRGSG